MSGPALHEVADTPPDITVVALGKPIPQGSKTRGRIGMWDDNAGRLRPWRRTVQAAASEAGQAWRLRRAREEDVDVWASPLTGPLRVEITFTMPKPARAPKGRRTWPDRRGCGDIDKLVRACFDSLTDAEVWEDDVRVIKVDAEKCYPQEGRDRLGRPGVLIDIWQVTA